MPREFLERSQRTAPAKAALLVIICDFNRFPFLVGWLLNATLRAARQRDSWLTLALYS
jgi:hypothetical protein